MQSTAVAEKSKMSQLVSFRLGDEEFGVPILDVQEIIRMTLITKVPQAPNFVEGVINLRGNVIPVVDLRKRFGVESKAADKDSRIIVVDIEERTIGIVVDSVSEVLRIQSDQMEPPPPIVCGLSADYIQAVGKLGERLLIMLDLKKILTSSEKMLMEKAIAE